LPATGSVAVASEGHTSIDPHPASLSPPALALCPHAVEVSRRVPEHRPALRRRDRRLVFADVPRDDDSEDVIPALVARVLEGFGIHETLLPEGPAQGVGQAGNVDHGHGG
jgi:hypothetical protein